MFDLTTFLLNAATGAIVGMIFAVTLYMGYMLAWPKVKHVILHHVYKP